MSVGVCVCAPCNSQLGSSWSLPAVGRLAVSHERFLGLCGSESA